jgi:hypothetical protein
VFPKLSKLLNQEDAWAHPVYAVISTLRRCALTGRRNAAERRIPSFRCHFMVRYTQVIMLTSADVSRWRRQMHGQSAPMQGQAAPSY